MKDIKQVHKHNRICECGVIATYGSQCTGCGKIEINIEAVKRLMLKISERKRPRHLALNIKRLFFNGESKTIRDWAYETGLSEGCINCRINTLKWSIEKTLITPSIRAIKQQRQEYERNIELSKRMLD